MEGMGRKRWAIAEAYIPSESSFADRALVSREFADQALVSRENVSSMPTIATRMPPFARRAEVSLSSTMPMRKADRLVISRRRNHLQCGTFRFKVGFAES